MSSSATGTSSTSGSSGLRLVRRVVAQEVGIAEKQHEHRVLARVQLDETRAVADSSKPSCEAACT